MSAETLRRAAVLIRERAEAATPGPWVPEPAPTQYRAYEGVVRTNHADFAECADEIADTLDHADSAHIASWHPAVAHAVAGFLEAIAHRQGAGSDLRWPHPEDVEWAEQIARAYLGESA